MWAGSYALLNARWAIATRLARKACVHSLRAVGVEQAADNAAKDKVMQMVDGLRAKRLGQAKRKQLDSAVAGFLSTYPETSAACGTGDGVGKQGNGFRLRGRSFLLTYNWLFTKKNFPDGTPKAASNDDLWSLWVAWKATKQKELRVSQSTSTVEESLNSSDDGRVHIHWKVNLHNPLDGATAEAFAFHDPHSARILLLRISVGALVIEMQQTLQMVAENWERKQEQSARRARLPKARV